jgi:uncharacterized membrane protein YkoI
LIHVSELSAARAHDGSMTATIRRNLVAFGLAAAAALLPVSSKADRDHDYNQARRAVEQGEALPLADILARVRPELGGEVVGVSFERKRDRWVYEFKVIDRAGLLWEVYVDATTAAVLKREGH